MIGKSFLRGLSRNTRTSCIVRHFSGGNQIFKSTRGHTSGDTDLFNVLRTGLAPDGGLFVAQDFSPLGLDKLGELVDAPYQQRLQKVIECFPTTGLPSDVLRPMIDQAYAHFNHTDVLPVSHLEGHHYLLEAFHGPTASFKDLSLQLTAKLVKRAMDSTGKPSLLGVLVATSGDTGTAALEAFSSQPDTFVIVLYPLQGVSDVQQAQMLTQAGNVCVLGVDADFDWCQNAVKKIFQDTALISRLKEAVPELTLTSANSINWGRFLPQIAFNVSGYCDLVRNGVVKLGDPIDVCVPTGNFGNILGAVYARRLGVPIRKLVCASNENNVLTDFLESGRYNIKDRRFHLTVSPAIDILVSSNLERFLHLLSEGNSEAVSELFNGLRENGEFEVKGALLDKVQAEVAGAWCDEENCLATIKNVFDRTRVLIDPHTAVAKNVADRFSPLSSSSASKTPMLISSTAHFSKFPHAMLKALGAEDPSAHIKASVTSPDPRQPSEEDIKYYSQLVSAIPSVLDPLHKLKPKNTFHPQIEQLADKPVLHTTSIPADHDVLVQMLESFVADAAHTANN